MLTPRGDWAMCCGFGVKTHARAKKLVRRGGREFFVARNRCTARLSPQSPVTFPNPRALLSGCRMGRRVSWRLRFAVFGSYRPCNDSTKWEGWWPVWNKRSALKMPGAQQTPLRGSYCVRAERSIGRHFCDPKPDEPERAGRVSCRNPLGLEAFRLSRPRRKSHFGTAQLFSQNAKSQLVSD